MRTAKLVVLGSINADHILNIDQFLNREKRSQGTIISSLSAVREQTRRLLLGAVAQTPYLLLVLGKIVPAKISLTS